MARLDGWGVSGFYHRERSLKRELYLTCAVPLVFNTRGCLFLSASGYAKSTARICKRFVCGDGNCTRPRYRFPALAPARRQETIGPALNGGWIRRGILRNASPAWSGQLPIGGFHFFEIRYIGFAGSIRQSIISGSDTSRAQDLFIRASGSRSLHKTISCCRPPVARSGKRRPQPGVYVWQGGDSAG